MMSKRLFMETTQINPSQTVSQIQEILGKYGAVAILIEYESSEVVAISFRLKTKKWICPLDCLAGGERFILFSVTGGNIYIKGQN